MSARVNNLLIDLLDLPWLTFLVYWMIKAFRTRKAEKKEPFASRYGVMAILICGYVLIFDPRARIGPLRDRLLPDTAAAALGGIVVTWLGVILAIWARHHLAENWSGRVTIKQGHELIRTGPYARLRHPIYTGLLLATLGTATFVGECRALLGFLLVLTAYSIKALREEAMLKERFGLAFDEHRRRTGFLLPRLHHS